MERTAEITLGESKFTVHKLNIDQLEEHCDALDAVSLAKTMRERFAAARALILAAVQHDEPGMTREALGKIETNAGEVFVAAGVIMRLTGFRKEPESGEGAAGVRPASETPSTST